MLIWKLMQSTFDERNWLAWLVKVRILILTFLLVIQLAVAELTPTRLPLRLFLSTMLLWYTLSLFYVALLSFWHENRLQASLQVLTDLIMVSLVVHETGGWDSSLNFLYPLAIIVAGILLPRIWAHLFAALAFILYGTVLELNYYGVVRSYCTTHPELKALQGIIFVNLFAFLAVAYLASLLVAKLRQARVQLKDASGALEDLQILHENIIQSISSGLITTGLDGRITLANHAAQKLMERTADQLLDIVTRESQRLNGIITDFLAYSRGKKYHFDKADLVVLLEDTLTLMRHRMTVENTGIAIESRFAVPEAWVIADGDRIKQVFWNIAENAVRAMRDGGTLKVGIERLGDDWQVSFADTGTGMTAQQTEKIFEPFQSSCEGGTGLGLAVVYQIVQAHEGKVWARSKPGQGTTFVLRLRRLDAERSASAPSAEALARPKLQAVAPAQFATAAAEGRLRG